MPSKSQSNHRPKSQPTLELSLRDYIEILDRWKYVIIGITLTVFIGAALYTYLGEFIYEATAIVQVNSKSTNEMMNALDLSSLSGPTRNLMKEIGILKSRVIAEDVLADLKKKPVATLGSYDTLEILMPADDEITFGPYANNETILGRLEGTMQFDPDKASDVIFVSALSTNPKEAAIIANAYADEYYQNNLNNSRKQFRSTREFLERTLETKKISLDAMEDSLRHYIEAHGAVEEGGQSVVQAISTLEAQRDEVDIEIETMKSTIQSYEKKLAEVKATLPKNEEQEIDADSKRIMDMVTSMEVTKILEQIAALEQQRDFVKEQNSDTPNQELVKKKVIEIEGQIAELRKQINDRMGINTSSPKKNFENRD